MQDSPPQQLDFWPPARIAAIDIGSNSVRLEIAQVDGAGGYRVLDEERENTRLAADLDREGRLSERAIAETVDALRNFLSIAKGFGVVQTRAIATSAVRDALNGATFCQRVRDELGLAVEVISPREEARLALLSVARAFDISRQQVAVVDIGGGSTEVVLASSGHIDVVYATRLGAVRVAEHCGLAEQCAGRALEAAERYVDKQLKRGIKKPPFVPAAVYGTGGTFTALASLLAARAGKRDQPLRGYRVTRAEVRHLMTDLASLPLEKRMKAAGLNPKRADIIVSGLLVVERVMHRLRVNTLEVHSRGVRDGLLLTMIEPAPQRQLTEEERLLAVERFAESCGVETPHARQVARIARSLVAQLRAPLALGDEDERLLVASAYLANVGYVINFDRHHKHSYHLIQNSDLPGHSPREVAVLANVARYHRGSAPKPKHKEFAALSPADQGLVTRLSALLRLAQALDRSRQQQVEGVTCEVHPDRVEIRVTSQGDAGVDLWAARRKAGLFEKVFGRGVVITQAAEPAEPVPTALSHCPGPLEGASG